MSGPVMRRLVPLALAVSFHAVAEDNPSAVPSMRPIQRITLSSLCAVASDALRTATAPLPPGSRIEVQCEAGRSAVDLPAGELRVQPGPIGKVLDGLQDVVLELRVDGRTYRHVRLPVRVTLEAPQWCAQEALVAGQALVPQHYVPCTRPLRHAGQWALAGQLLPGGRLKRALRPGELLMARDVADGELRLRGDAVTVVLRAGAFTLESLGRLGQDARVGDTVNVQLQGSAQTVIGRLAAAQLVEVESNQ